MKIETLAQYNALMGGCCDCGLPGCSDGSVKCESLEHVTFCADDDYSDSYAKWLADRYYWQWLPLRDWQRDLAIWLAAEPGREAEDYPVTEPDIRDADDYEVAEPEKPAGYDDVLHGCWAQFKEPEGVDPSAEIGLLYGTWRGTDFTYEFSGSGWGYETDAFGSDTYETLVTVVVSGTTPPGDALFTITGNIESGESCTSQDYLGADQDQFYTVSFTDGAPEPVCENTERGSKVTSTAASGSVTPTTLQGCPGPFERANEYGYDYEIITKETELLGAPKNKESLGIRARANLPTVWLEHDVGSNCLAELLIENWPKVEDFYKGGDPEADPPVPADWPPCDDPIASFLPPENPKATASKFRYKVGVPSSYMAHRLWIKEHAEWVYCESLTPGECGTEPEEPQIFHYFAQQWDIVFFPKEWEAWRVLWDAFKEAERLKEEWDACELLTPGDCGPEPEVPDDPTADQPVSRPVFVDENLFWEWTGGETEDEQYSDWYEVSAPTEEGITRMVNKQSLCYRSARLKIPPQPFGETYNPDDYPA